MGSSPETVLLRGRVKRGISLLTAITNKFQLIFLFAFQPQVAVL